VIGKDPVELEKYLEKKFALPEENISTLILFNIQSVPELAYIPLTANVNIYSEIDSAKNCLNPLVFKLQRF
jgi:hypothetical protein